MSRDVKSPNQGTTLGASPIRIKAPSHNESANITQEDLEPILVQETSHRPISTQMIQPEVVQVGQLHQSKQGQPNPRTNVPIPPHTSEQPYPDHPTPTPMVRAGQTMVKPPGFPAPIRAQTMQNFQEQGGPSNYESSQVCVGQCTGWLGTYVPCLCCCPYPYHNVPEGFSGIVMRFGKFYKLVGPGLHYLNPELDTLALVDKREKVIDLRSQNVVSRDNTSFNIDAVVYYKILNTYKSKFAVANLHGSLQELAITCLRNAVGQLTIQQFLESKDTFSNLIENEIAHGAESWGIKVMRVLVQDVVLPDEFRNSFSTGALAKKIAEAQLIHSKAEVQAAMLMKEAADALNTDAAFQIRYITALEAISNNENPKMIFFPSDFNDVGALNDELVHAIHEDMEGLIQKQR